MASRRHAETVLVLFYNFKHCMFLDFFRCSAYDGSQGLGISTLFPNHFSQIFLCDLELYDNTLLAFDLCNLNLLRIINQRFHHFLNKIFHKRYLLLEETVFGTQH
jgi:hypothetical protein